MTDHDLADRLHRLADDLGLQGYAPMGATVQEAAERLLSLAAQNAALAWASENLVHVHPNEATNSFCAGWPGVKAHAYGSTIVEAIVNLRAAITPTAQGEGKRGEEWSHEKITAYIQHYGEYPYGMGSLAPSELAKNKPWPPGEQQ